jgi:hypothetical protein
MAECLAGFVAVFIDPYSLLAKGLSFHYRVSSKIPSIMKNRTCAKAKPVV